jgi:very-short-patch-repair endonuclease
MTSRRIVRGQKINSIKLEQAKALRRRMTSAEHRLWQALRGSQLGGLHFRRQQVVDGLIADFYCNATGLIIEVDGSVHEQQQEYD